MHMYIDNNWRFIMSKKQDAKRFRQKLAEAKLTQVAFGKKLDRDPRTITRWASGRDNIPAYVWLTLDSLLSKKTAHESR